MSVTSTSPAGTPVSFADPAVVGGQAPVTVACTPASGSTFAIGSTTVECGARDALDRAAACQFEVTHPQSRIGPAGLPSLRLIVVPSTSYPTVLGKLLATRYSDQASQFVIENQGRSGELAREAVPRFLRVFSATRPEVLLLMEGYNDIGTGENGAASGAAAALSTMASEARNRGTRVFIATLAPSLPAPGSIPPALLDDFNRRVHAVAAGEGAVLVDVYSALLSDVKAYIGADGVHLTASGYRKMAETFFAAIRATLEVP
jgi:lysophospholipase L1-like esterase